MPGCHNDAASNVTTTKDSLGGVLTSVYNADNLLSSRQFGGTGQTQARIDLTYNTRNDVATETRYSDVAGTQLVGTTAYSYDSADRVTNIQHTNSSSSVIANYTYAYDLASRLTSEIDNGATTNFGYDANSELMSAGLAVYNYDLAGNRTMTGYSTGTGNEMSNDGAWTYTYDKNGNMTEKSMGPSATTWFYGYDNQNNLTSATEYSAASGGTLQAQATYVYDAMGDRIERDEWTQATGTVVTRFGYDSGNVWGDLNGSNQLQDRRLYLDGVDQVFARIDSSGNEAWYLPDRLGSIRVVMNSADTTTDVVSYDAFGNIASESNSTFGDRYKWTGQQTDSLTGLQYNVMRQYSPSIGRFTSQDPLGFGGGDANLYRYTGNSPTNATDPMGTDANPANDPLGGVTPGGNLGDGGGGGDGGGDGGPITNPGGGSGGGGGGPAPVSGPPGGGGPWFGPTGSPPGVPGPGTGPTSGPGDGGGFDLPPATGWPYPPDLRNPPPPGGGWWQGPIDPIGFGPIGTGGSTSGGATSGDQGGVTVTTITETITQMVAWMPSLGMVGDAGTFITIIITTAESGGGSASPLGSGGTGGSPTTSPTPPDLISGPVLHPVGPINPPGPWARCSGTGR